VASKTLAEQASEYEEQRAAIAKRLKNSERVIGDVRVGLVVDEGVVSVLLGVKDQQPRGIPATDFIRMIGWFVKHYGPFDPAVEPGEEA
jgi:hypothetical protein